LRKTRAGYDTRLGVALASLGRDQEAVAAYDAAIQLGGATPSLHENRGIVLMRLARAAAALSDLRAAYDAVPRADLAASLGYAYQACGPTGERVSASDWFKMSDQEFLDRYAPAAASRRGNLEPFLARRGPAG
jgi:tetratricopeptide (TPR) repeat protein